MPVLPFSPIFCLVADEFESQLSKLTRDYNESKKEILTLNEELLKYKDKSFELETERDRFARESERHAKVAEEREKVIEKLHSEMADVKEQFADYKKRIELELESTKQNVSAMDDLSVELERSRGQLRQMEADSNLVREENRSLAAKVEELQEDIEGMSASLWPLLFGSITSLSLLNEVYSVLSRYAYVSYDSLH